MNWYKKGIEPIFSIGPDFHLSITELVLVNLGMFLLMENTAEYGTLEYWAYLACTIVHNIAFICAILLNPGMLSRDPSIHSIAYLKKIAKLDLKDRICEKCNLIKPNKVRET